MGIMSTYCGSIYNEFFALKTNMFGSCYDLNNLIRFNTNEPEWDKKTHWYWERNSPDCTYPFGLDPVWSAAENELTISNAVKMKLSVIFGVFHMSIGIAMKGTNMIFRNMWLEFFTEVIAGFFMLFFLFGWMDVLIIMKWFQTPNVYDCS